MDQTQEPRHGVEVAPGHAGSSMQAADARDSAASGGTPMLFEFAIDAQLLPRNGALNILNAFRVGFWLKDHALGEATRELSVSHPVLMAFGRAAELTLVDVPLAAYAGVLPHEVYGHGGRIREFGGTATYQFQIPPPYYYTPSMTKVGTAYRSTPDANIIVSQAGIQVESYQLHECVVSSFEADTLNRIDAGLMVGEPIHEIVEATLPFKTIGDVRNWSALEATRYHVPASSIRGEYLAGTVITGLSNPTFLYGLYASFWKFIVRGERTGPLPALHAGPFAFLATTHASPTPWGIEYGMSILGRLHGDVLEVAPHFGQGPGGRFMALDADLVSLHLTPHVSVGAGLNVWRQPQLSVTSSGSVVGAPTLSGALGAYSKNREPSSENGVGGHALVRWERGVWSVGLRADAKSTGLYDLSPIASDFEVSALIGLRLGRP